MPALLHAVQAHRTRRLIEADPRWQKTTGRIVDLEDRADDVAAALALLRVARADLEGALLLAARFASTSTGRPLLTFKKIAAAKASWTDKGVRDKVGATNHPLPELLHASLDAGLTLVRFAEGRVPTPTVLEIKGTKSR
ncbi:hypothetical protein [Streptomyces sp. NL15-2K]|uniref:hypothetical protein n=1 Tax=Streptomyces sp. NL15-2K TaxID=376149 RepID=UPI000F5607D8|nr:MULTISPECIES: hypothetical protein [Actinomycetes]WKX13532.1 hypothetical protein Q4V64_40800 [Kutzneria buriramensis]GCB45080.1 hypothetical protein SNL152K_2370 [Streptomyces sp. NL15-2K]